MDFLNKTDWSHYTIAGLLSEIEGHADSMRGATLYALSWIMEPARELAERAERAERAEARVAELKETVRELTPRPSYIQLQARVAAAEARVAELEDVLTIALDVLSDCAEVFHQDARAIDALARVQNVMFASQKAS